MHPAVQEAGAVRVTGARSVDHLLDRGCFLHMLLASMHDDRALAGARHDEEIVVLADGFQRGFEIVGPHQCIDLVLVGNDDLHAFSDGLREGLPVPFDTERIR